MPNQFEQWFPSSAVDLTRIVRDNCSPELQTYQHHQGSQELCRDVLNCILAHSDPNSLAIYQAANVLLGLTPSALLLLGNSTAEISLLSSERPLLAILLAVGAPTITPFGAFKYQDPLGDLKARENGIEYPRFSRTAQAIVSAGQYIVAAAAATNVALLAYDLSSKAIWVPYCAHTFVPFIWMYTAGLVHLIAICSFATRVTIKRNGSSKKRNRIRSWLRSEITPCALHHGLSYGAKKESYLGLFLAWLASIATVVVFVLGTLLLSSTTLIDTRDAVIIIIRYAASTIFCRVVLMFELYGLQAAVLRSSIERTNPAEEVVLQGHELQGTSQARNSGSASK